MTHYPNVCVHQYVSALYLSSPVVSVGAELDVWWPLWKHLDWEKGAFVRGQGLPDGQMYARKIPRDEHEALWG